MILLLLLIIDDTALLRTTTIDGTIGELHADTRRTKHATMPQ
jgi:hypothetical protein